MFAGRYVHVYFEYLEDLICPIDISYTQDFWNMLHVLFFQGKRDSIPVLLFPVSFLQQHWLSLVNIYVPKSC